MSRTEKTLERILRGGSDASVRYDDLCAVLRKLGFSDRMRGSHHIFVKPGIEKMINLQRDGSNAKSYQVRQVRAILLEHGLGRETQR